MKLPDRLGRRSGRPFHSAIATSFAIEFTAVEEILMPQLLASGASNILLVADARMAAMALSDGSILPTALGRDYALYSPPASDGIFHPKIILQIGRDRARAFVGSANLTAAGLAGNAEVVTEIECKDEEGIERDIIRAIWRYLDGLIPAHSSPARDALRWARERASWLDRPGGDPLLTLSDGSAIAFLASAGAGNEDQGITDRFVSLVGGAKVQTLVVVSPYWDSNLAALADLAGCLSPKSIILPIDPLVHEFPKATAFARKVRIVPLEWPARRFTHAKVILASTASHDHVLFGSANCTVAALGRPGTGGANAEACIYRRLPKGAAREALGLDRWIDGEPIALAELTEPIAPPAIPLREIEARHPGSFDLNLGMLHWVPGKGVAQAGEVQLLDGAARLLLAIPVSSFHEGGQDRTVALDPSLHKLLRFARFATGDKVSTLAHVTHREALRSRRREAATGSVARALAPFTNGSDFDLWMLQAFETLARADFEQEADPQALSGARPRGRRDEEAEAVATTLSYEEFTRAKAGTAGSCGEGGNSLAGTYSDNIRAFLNLLSGRGALPTDVEDDPSFDDIDEEQGDTDPEDSTDETPESEERDDGRETPQSEAIDPKIYERHVVSFAEGLEWDEEPLGSRDVLRLRYWMVFLLLKARCPDLPKGLDTSGAPQGWPRFLVRILVAFFCGRTPAITRVMLGRDYEAMPVDFLECWITILWSLDAIERLLAGRPKDREFLKFIPTLRKRIVVLLGLAPGEVNSDFALEVRKRRRTPALTRSIWLFADGAPISLRGRRSWRGSYRC